MQTQASQPTVLENKTSELNETIDVSAILSSIGEDKYKEEYKIENYQNNDDIKRMKKRSMKLQKDISTILESKNDTRDKITEIFSKFQKLAADTKLSHEKYYKVSKTYPKMKADRDAAEAEITKHQSTNNNLESLCKGLQKQNQDLLDENKKIQNDEKELRTKLAAEFQERINTISTQLEEQAREHLHKSKENELIKAKLAEVAEKFESREKIFTEEIDKRGTRFEDHYKEIQEKFKSIEEEADKIDEYTAEQEKVKAESDQIKEKLKKLTDKSELFQTLMSQTNSFFLKIKAEMDKATLKNKKLDEENIDLQKKSERSNITVLELVEEYKKLQKEFEKSEGQKEGLNKLMETIEKSLKEKTAKLQELQGPA